MNAASIALAGSLLANLVLIWKLLDANYRAALLRADVNYWRDSANDWRRMYDDLRRNSVLRDPKTGRYMKGYRRNV